MYTGFRGFPHFLKDKGKGKVVPVLN